MAEASNRAIGYFRLMGTIWSRSASLGAWSDTAKLTSARLLASARAYLDAQTDKKRVVTIEYTLLAGVNDSVEQARELAALLKDYPCKINLIPFNTVPGIAYKRSGTNAINRFRSELMRLGLTTITRRTRGADIAAACGQLAGEVQDRTHRSAKLAAAQ